MLLFFGILGFQYLLQHLCPHGFLFTFLRRAKIRRQAQLMEMLLQQPHAKSMYRGNFRPVHQHQLSAQTRVLGLLCCQPRECIRDFSTHFTGCRFRKGYNQKGVNVTGILRVCHPFQHTLYQYGSLAGTGCRGNQQGTAPIINRCLLFFCPVNAHVLLLLPVPRQCSAKIPPA